MMAPHVRGRRGGSWGSLSWALLLVVGAVLATATAALAFWTVTVSFAPGNFALANAASLSAPTTPTATVNGSSAITIGWTLPASQLTGAHYQVTRTGGPGSPFTVCTAASSATSCQDTGLSGGTTYNYSIVAVLGTSWQSSAITTSATTNKASQSISFTSSTPVGAVVGGVTYTPTATATSGLTVALTIDSSSTSVCSITAGVVSFTAVGSCVIDANQGGNANYLPAPQVQQSFVVGKGSQTISFTSTAPSNAVVGGTAYTPAATATSGLAVAVTIDATSTSVCSISGGAVSFSAVGLCVIDANQPGNTNWNAALEVQQSFAVGKGSQTITFTSTAPSNAIVGGATYTVTATGGASGNPVTFSIDSSTSSNCSIAGSTVSFTGAGTCTIDANQAGNANYNAAPQAQQSFAVGKGNQTITFTSTAPSNAVVAGPTYTVTAAGGASGNAVALTIDSSTTADCSIAGSTVSFTGAGTCTIDANQAGSANYNAAPQAQQSFAVGKGSQTISFTSTAPSAAAVGGATYTPTATATSGLTVTFTIDATSSSVCSISGGVVSFQAVGTCVVDANQTGDANWNAAPQKQQSFSVAKGSQTISFTSTAPSNAVVNGATYTPSATATSGLAVTFSIDATSSSVCSISSGVVSFNTAGTCKVDANQAGNSNWNAAPQVQQSFSVSDALTFSSCSVSSGGSATCTSTGSATVTLKKPNQGGSTWTAKVTLVNGSGTAVTNAGPNPITVNVTSTTSGATITFSSGTALTIPVGQSQSSNSFTYNNAGVTNGAGADTVTASSGTLSSAVGHISW